MRQVMALAAAWAVAAAAVAPSARVYIVSRATTVEGRALLSGRLVGLNATSLQWLENSGVVRVELPGDVVEQVKSDKDVVLVFSSEEGPPAVMPAPAPAGGCSAASVGAQLPMPGVIPGLGGGMTQGMEMGGLGMALGGTGMGGGMGMGGMGMSITNMLDFMAGSLARKMFNRTPSCHIAVKETKARFARAGGDGVVPVKASGTCAWQAQASVEWIKINSGSGASGSGVVTYTVKPGTGKERTGMISLVAAGASPALRGAASLIVTQGE